MSKAPLNFPKENVDASPAKTLSASKLFTKVLTALTCLKLNASKGASSLRIALTIPDPSPSILLISSFNSSIWSFKNLLNSVGLINLGPLGPPPGAMFWMFNSSKVRPDCFKALENFCWSPFSLYLII